MQVEGCTLSPLCGDGEEEDLELSVLPKNTKVVVTGNNRTNRDLLGLHGVVKKAVGFGWHWLVLINGSEVKLQRNALSVIELPTGQEEDGENDCEHPSSNNNSMDLGCDDLHKTYKPKSRSRVLGGSSSRNHSHSTQLQSTGSNFHSHGMLKVDLSKLETSALWRYWRHFNLVEVGPNPSKDQLVGAVERHFISQQLDELQVITGFVQAAKRLKTVCS